MRSATSDWNITSSMERCSASSGRRSIIFSIAGRRDSSQELDDRVKGAQNDHWNPRCRELSEATGGRDDRRRRCPMRRWSSIGCCSGSTCRDAHHCTNSCDGSSSTNAKRMASAACSDSSLESSRSSMPGPETLRRCGDAPREAKVARCRFRSSSMADASPSVIDSMEAQIKVIVGTHGQKSNGVFGSSSEHGGPISQLIVIGSVMVERRSSTSATAITSESTKTSRRSLLQTSQLERQLVFACRESRGTSTGPLRSRSRDAGSVRGHRDGGIRAMARVGDHAPFHACGEVRRKRERHHEQSDAARSIRMTTIMRRVCTADGQRPANV